MGAFSTKLFAGPPAPLSFTVLAGAVDVSTSDKVSVTATDLPGWITGKILWVAANNKVYAIPTASINAEIKDYAVPHKINNSPFGKAYLVADPLTVAITDVYEVQGLAGLKNEGTTQDAIYNLSSLVGTGTDVHIKPAFTFNQAIDTGEVEIKVLDGYNGNVYQDYTGAWWVNIGGFTYTHNNGPQIFEPASDVKPGLNDKLAFQIYYAGVLIYTYTVQVYVSAPAIINVYEVQSLSGLGNKGTTQNAIYDLSSFVGAGTDVHIKPAFTFDQAIDTSKVEIKVVDGYNGNVYQDYTGASWVNIGGFTYTHDNGPQIFEPAGDVQSGLNDKLAYQIYYSGALIYTYTVQVYVP
jgi:hypothetical protein